jgi:hypothetical protein
VIKVSHLSLQQPGNLFLVFPHGVGQLFGLRENLLTQVTLGPLGLIVKFRNFGTQRMPGIVDSAPSALQCLVTSFLLCLKTIGQRSKLVGDELLERLEAPFGVFAKIERLLGQSLLDPHEPSFIVAHLAAEQDFPDFVDVADIRRLDITADGGSAIGFFCAGRRYFDECVSLFLS